MVCPISIVGPDGTRILYGGEPPVPDTPPAPPTGLTAVAGDAQVTLTWNPNTEPDLADYRVRTTSPTDQLSAIVPADQTTYTETGLTNGQAYTYVLRAKDAAGNVSEDSAAVTVTPRATSSGTRTIFGYNTADDAPLSGRLVKWGNRAPCVRRYHSGFLSSGSFPITTAVAPEKRVSYSFKSDGSSASTNTYSAAGLAAGNGNARLRSFLRDIPDGWTVFLTYYHEVNDDINDWNNERVNDNGDRIGISHTHFKSAYTQFYSVVTEERAALEARGVTVVLAANFMAYLLTAQSTGPTAPAARFHDDWVPGTDQMDALTFDIYGNPGNFTGRVKNLDGTTMEMNCASAQGAEYVSGLPNVVTRFADMFKVIERRGFKDAWGILELNTPPRDWDGPTNPDYRCGTNKRLRYQGGRTALGHDATHTEKERAAWLEDAIDHCLNPPMTGKTPPMVLLIWEHPAGVNWNQKFYHDNVWNAIKPYMVGSP